MIEDGGRWHRKKNADLGAVKIDETEKEKKKMAELKRPVISSIDRIRWLQCKLHIDTSATLRSWQSVIITRDDILNLPQLARNDI